MKLMYQLFNLNPKHANAPTDHDLAVFTGKIAGIKVRETEPNDQGRQYNWVAEIHDSKGFKCETGIKKEVVHTKSAVETAFSRNTVNMTDGLEDLPF